MTIKTMKIDTYFVEISIEGDYERILRICQTQCTIGAHDNANYPFGIGCVTVTKAHFVFCGAEPIEGCLIRLVNHPRVKKHPSELFETAKILAIEICKATGRLGAWVIAPDKTESIQILKD